MFPPIPMPTELMVNILKIVTSPLLGFKAFVIAYITLMDLLICLAISFREWLDWILKGEAGNANVDP